MKKLLLLLVVSIQLACGKQGNPTAPAPVIPKGSTDLLVSQRGTSVLLAWSYPALTTSGRQLTTLRRVTVYRYVEELPASLAGLAPEAMPSGDADARLPKEIALFATRPAIAPAQFMKLREKVAALKKDELPAYSSGARILFTDRPSFRTEDNRPVRVHYAVSADTDILEGELSNLVSIVLVEPAVAPAAVMGKVQPDAVKLQWSAPSKTSSGQIDPSIVGYNVYRFSSSAQADPEPKPVNSAPVKETTFSDTPPLGAYTYQVTAVASAMPLVESLPSEPFRVDFRDRVAPPVPADLTVLVELRAIRLIWTAVDASDLAGYKVYREADGKRETLTTAPTSAVFFADTSVVAGTTYRYSVTSIDKNGNESAPTAAATGLVPR